MSTLLEILRESKSTGNFQLLMDAIPYARFMGMQIAEHDGVRRAKLPFRESLIGNPAVPALHGGTVGALLESTAIFELLWTSETIVLPKVITVTIDYLRPAGPRDIYARAEITRLGRRVATVHASAFQDDPPPAAMSLSSSHLSAGTPSSASLRPAASAIVHLLLKPRE